MERGYRELIIMQYSSSQIASVAPSCRGGGKACGRYLARWVILLLIIGTAADAADTGVLLDKVAKAYGGEERLAETTVWQQYGTTVSTLYPQPGELHRAFAYPDRLRIEISYEDDSSELRILSGAVAWNRGEKVSGIKYSSMLLQAARLGLPNTLIVHRNSLQDTGTMTGQNGNSLRSLELAFHGNLRLVAGIDPETGRILETRGFAGTGQGQGMAFATTYDDFRMIGGRLFAFRETHYIMGKQRGQTLLERIELAEQLPGTLFEGTPPVRPGPGQHIARRQ